MSAVATASRPPVMVRSSGSETPDPGGHDERVRAHTWGLLGALLAAPADAELLDVLASVDVPGDVDAEFAAAWRQLRIAAARGDAAAVADEYQNLFIGIGRGEVVPYGSWYLTGFLLDRPLAVLRADLAALGFERQAGVREPEDHAAALCETMAMLIESGHGLDEQRRFFQSHVETWMGSFFGDLRDARSAAFYRAVAEFGGQFVDFESGYLTMLA